jgi:hypothetical protein
MAAVLALFCLAGSGARAQQPGDTAWTTLPLQDLSAFAGAGANWILASGARADYTVRGDLEADGRGTGVVINHPSPQNHTHLITRRQFGDVEISLDFMMAKGSNSGVYLEGRYEVQLLDSWMKPHPSSAGCGGIYQRWDDSRPKGHKGYGGTAPLLGACRAPGLWQHLLIRFRAPRFDSQGKKTANARFEKVWLNGVLVQDQTEVTGPTRSSFNWKDEKPAGPLVLQGDHGKVAFRDIRFRPLRPLPARRPVKKDPVFLNPAQVPVLLRSFMQRGARKLTYVISLGDPGNVNYSYDLSQGALFQVWRGPFLDVTGMWHSRGQAQTATPLGAVEPLSDAPAVAVLDNLQQPWPDSAAFDDVHDEGYVLDKARIPTFSYALKGVEVKDRIAPRADHTGFDRTLTVTSPPAHLYGRIVCARKVEKEGKERYRVDGAYYIRIDKHFHPLVRQTAAGQEMLVPVDGSRPLTYSIIW